MLREHLFDYNTGMEQQSLIPDVPPRATSTRATYQATLRLYDRYLEGVRKERPDPDALAGFLRDRATAGKRLSTIRKDLHAIAAILVDAGYEDPRNYPGVQNMLKSITAEVPVAAKAPKRAILTGGVRAAIEALHKPRSRKLSPGEELRALRDAAALLIGFAGALKRDELRTLLVENVLFTDEGLELVVNSSDDDRRARHVVIPRGQHPMTDPVTTYQRYVKAADVTAGYVFRPISGDGRVGVVPIDPANFTILLKRRLKAVGVDGSLLSPLSIRRGFIAMASAEGASLSEVAEQTGHRETVHIQALHSRARAVGKKARHLLSL